MEEKFYGCACARLKTCMKRNEKTKLSAPTAGTFHGVTVFFLRRSSLAFRFPHNFAFCVRDGLIEVKTKSLKNKRFRNQGAKGF